MVSSGKFPLPRGGSLRGRGILSAVTAVAAAAVIVAAAAVAAPIAAAVAAEDDEEYQNDPQTGVTAKTISTHDYSPFCRCARLTNLFSHTMRSLCLRLWPHRREFDGVCAVRVILCFEGLC